VRALRGIIGKAEMVVAGKSQTNPIKDNKLEKSAAPPEGESF
jgi:hypothetical protein